MYARPVYGLTLLAAGGAEEGKSSPKSNLRFLSIQNVLIESRELHDSRSVYRFTLARAERRVKESFDRI